MMRLIRLYSVAFGMLCILGATVQAQQPPKPDVGQNFAFKYAVGKPLVYLMGVKTKTDMNMKLGAEKESLKMAIDMRFRSMFTPTADRKNGISEIRYEPSDIEADFDITGTKGNVVATIRGADVKGTHDGVVIIDTKQDIGVGGAKEIKKNILPLYLSGQMDFDTHGNVKEVRGDLPFVEFWTESDSLQAGFTGIVFPEKAVAVGDTWQVDVHHKKFGSIKLENEGVKCPVTYTRKADEIIQNKEIAIFTVSGPCSFKNVTGFMEEKGKTTRLNISHLDRSLTGMIRFDQNRGVLFDSSMESLVNISVNATINGKIGTVDLKLNVETNMRAPVTDNRP